MVQNSKQPKQFIVKVSPYTCAQCSPVSRDSVSCGRVSSVAASAALRRVAEPPIAFYRFPALGGAVRKGTCLVLTDLHFPSFCHSFLI